MRFVCYLLIIAVILACGCNNTSNSSTTKVEEKGQPAAQNPSSDKTSSDKTCGDKTCGDKTCGDKTPDGSDKGVAKVEPKISDRPMPGGYMNQDPLSEEMTKVARQATALLQKEYPDYTLIKVHKAATQVVAGTNYFLRLEFKTIQDNVIWDLVVFEGLDRSLTITKKEQIK